MYIPDKTWDEIVSSALELLDVPDIASSSLLSGYLNAIINLEDQTVPRKKRVSEKGYHKIRKGRDYMRKFSKYFIIRYASSKINNIKSVSSLHKSN